MAAVLIWAASLAAGGVGCDLGPAAATPRVIATPIALIVEPDAGRQAVLDLVASARESLWMEMYLLTDAGAIATVAERAAAGCDVRVILEPAPYQEDGANQSAYDQLRAAGVDVRWSLPRFTYTHAKAFTIDHRRLAILTLNLTGAGLTGNREYAALDDDATDVAAAEAIFTADALGAATGTPPANAGRLISSPESSRPTLLALLGGAQRLAGARDGGADRHGDHQRVARRPRARRGGHAGLARSGRGSRRALHHAGRRRRDRPGRRRAGDSRQGRGRRRPHALPRVGQPDPHLARRQS